MDIKEVEALAEWSEPKEVQTKYGTRLLRKAAVTDRFSAAWKVDKPAIKALGAGFSKDKDDQWELTWWQELPTEIKAQRAQSVEDSRAAKADHDLPCPEGLSYYPFQNAGIFFGLNRKHVLIADEMGLGKTIQAIGIVNGDPEVKTVLIICPKSVKLNWSREFAKWQTRGLSIGMAGGSGKNGNGWVGTDVVIINYEQVKKYKQQIDARHWGALIIDEAHYIKSAKTQRSQMIKGAGHKDDLTGEWIQDIEPIKADRHIRLTGTPIVNRPIELHNLISDMDPRFQNFWAFAKKYAGAYRGPYGWVFGGASKLDELQRLLRETIMVRRLKADVLTELPPKIRQVVPIEPETAAQRAAVAAEQGYEDRSDAELEDLRAAVELAKADSEEAYRAAVADLTVRSKLAFEEMARLRHETAVAKVPAVLDHVREMLEDNDQKIIIAAHHHDVIDALVAELAEFKPVSLTGRDSEKARNAAVDAFQNDPSVRVFVASIQAAGVGITLTASSTVIFAELDWVPGNISQMEDRAHRIGQVMPVLVQHLVLDGSIDARMAHELVSKQQVIDSALDKEHPERTRPVYVPKNGAATHQLTFDELTKQAEKITPQQIEAIHTGLRILAALDPDRAANKNGIGFNGIDGAIGHSLAGCAKLSPKQAALGRKVLLKYHGQLGDELTAAIKGEGAK